MLPLHLNRLVIIDRWIDPLTPLLHQLTYAGILDEMYGIGMVGSIKVRVENCLEAPLLLPSTTTCC